MFIAHQRIAVVVWINNLGNLVKKEEEKIIFLRWHICNIRCNQTHNILIGAYGKKAFL